MRKLFILFLPIIILCGLCWYFLRSSNPSLHPPAFSKHSFDRSLGIHEFGRNFVLHRSLDQQIRHIARDLIEKRKNEWKPGAASSIPHIIHQIWLSNDPLPDDLSRASHLVQQQHPGFRYLLWKQNDVKGLLQELIGPEYTSLPSLVLRDIVAAAVLLQYGGVVIDVEDECVHPITSLLPLGDCLIGFEPPLANTKRRRRLFLSPSVIAATPSHPLIKSYLAEMLTRIKKKEAANSVDQTWIAQDSLTTVALKLRPDQGRPLFLGPSFFCPVSPQHIHHLQRVLDREVRQSSLKKILRTLHLTSVPPFSDISRETLFVHMKGGRLSTIDDNSH